MLSYQSIFLSLPGLNLDFSDSLEFHTWTGGMGKGGLWPPPCSRLPCLPTAGSILHCKGHPLNACQYPAPCPSFMQTSVPQGYEPHWCGPLSGRWAQVAGRHKSRSALWVIWQGIPRSGYLEDTLEWGWWALDGHVPYPAVCSSRWEGHSQRWVGWDTLKCRVQGRGLSCLDLKGLLFKNEDFLACSTVLPLTCFLKVLYSKNSALKVFSHLWKGCKRVQWVPSFSLYTSLGIYLQSLLLNHLRISCRHCDPLPLNRFCVYSLWTRTLSSLTTAQWSKSGNLTWSQYDYRVHIQILSNVPAMLFRGFFCCCCGIWLLNSFHQGTFLSLSLFFMTLIYLERAG